MSMTYKCPICGFDLGDGPGESGKCEGCGTKVQPAQDDSVPAPGFKIPRNRADYKRDEEGNLIRDEEGEPLVENKREEQYIVTDEDREKYPELEDVLVILKHEYTFGRGIGAEPNGYLRTEMITVESSDRDCPECGHDEVLVDLSQDNAGIAGGKNTKCNRCKEVLDEEVWN